MTAPVNISVLVPVYNVEPYLAQCLESICSQTLRELEIVCVDDASTDGSPRALPVKTCISITPFFHGAGGFASSAGRLTFTASGPDPLPAVLRPAVPSSRWIT